MIVYNGFYSIRMCVNKPKIIDIFNVLCRWWWANSNKNHNVPLVLVVFPQNIEMVGLARRWEPGETSLEYHPLQQIDRHLNCNNTHLAMNLNSLVLVRQSLNDVPSDLAAQFKINLNLFGLFILKTANCGNMRTMSCLLKLLVECWFSRAISACILSTSSSYA